MVYEVILTGKILKALEKLPKKEQLKILDAVENLKNNPRPFGVKKLQGEDNAYRIRVGNYRIIYDLNDRQLRILILKIAHRQAVYENL